MIGHPFPGAGGVTWRGWPAIAVACAVAALLAIAAWGYRRPELFLDLAQLPIC